MSATFGERVVRIGGRDKSVTAFRINRKYDSRLDYTTIRLATSVV